MSLRNKWIYDRWIPPTEQPMAVTATRSSAMIDYLYGSGRTPIERLRADRKPDAKPKKPKAVTDEQLLAIVEELEAKIAKADKAAAAAMAEAEQGRTERIQSINSLRSYVWENFKSKWFAPDRSAF